MTYQELEQQHTSGVYPKRDLTLVRGKDATLWDDQGREYIDCASNQGVSTLGHANEAVAQAIYEQATTLLNCSEIFYNDRRAQFLEALSSILPPALKRIYLCNSGAEAVEAAIKFARLSTGRPNIVATVRGLPRPHHGRAVGHVRAEIPRAVQAARARLHPRALQSPGGTGRCRHRRDRGHHRSSRSRARAACTPPRRSTCAARARSPTAWARC